MKNKIMHPLQPEEIKHILDMAELSLSYPEITAMPIWGHNSHVYIYIFFHVLSMAKILYTYIVNISEKYI